MHSTQNLRHTAIAMGTGLLLTVAAPTVSADRGTDHDSQASRTSVKADRDIVETAIAAGSFETLVAALEAAGLAETLQGEGPFTVFAPTDAAFAALPEGTVESLLEPENREKLGDILTYHVVSGRVPARVAAELDAAETLNGEKIDLNFDGETLKINGATVVKADIETSNGLIHVIDAVLLPGQRMQQASAAEELIRRAIDRGAPMYNHGNEAACAAVYETAADALLAMDVLSVGQERRMTLAMREAAGTHDMSRRAWMMRYALDEAYASLGEMRTSMN